MDALELPCQNSAPMSQRKSLVALFALLAAVAGAAYFLRGDERPHLPGSPLEQAPATATAIAWVDVPTLFASRPWARLVTARGLDRPLHHLADACDSSPIDRVRELTAFATGEAPGHLEKVGFVARGDLGGSEMEACLQSIVADDGGGLTRTEVGDEPALAGRGDSRLVMVGDEGVVIADRETIRGLLAAFRGDGRSAGDDPVLTELWSSIRSPTADAIFVAHVPEGWRGALSEALRENRGRRSWCARARSSGRRRGAAHARARDRHRAGHARRAGR